MSEKRIEIIGAIEKQKKTVHEQIIKLTKLIEEADLTLEEKVEIEKDMRNNLKNYKIIFKSQKRLYENFIK
jgi:hypothetical protein